MKKNFLLIVMLFIAVLIIYPVSVFAFPQHIKTKMESQTYPRIANYYLRWGIENEAELNELAKWDLVIIDAEAIIHTPQMLKKLKQKNKNLILLAYITSQSIRNNAYNYKGSLRSLRASYIPSQWYLYDMFGNRLSNWLNTSRLNISTHAPLYNGQYYYDYLSDFVTKNVLNNDIFDGVFYDNVFDSISWFSSQIDLNLDGIPESSGVLDKAWNDGVRNLLLQTKIKNKGKLVVGNGGISYLDLQDGLMFENFDNTPYGNWEQTIRKYIDASKNDNKIIIINTNTAGKNNAQNYQLFRYGLASTLLGNGYSSFDLGPSEHAQTWWYDEYEYALGNPIGEAYNIFSLQDKNIKKSVWRRDFEDGIVLLNSSQMVQNIDLKTDFERLHGTQDTVINSGLISRYIDIAPKDGILLLKPLNRIRTASFVNGQFVRVFNPSGQVLRTGFFAYENRFANGVRVVSVVGDKNIAWVVAEKNYIKIYNKQGLEIIKFFPYTKKFVGTINFQVADLENDGFQEIITAPNIGGPQLRIFNLAGKLINPGFFAYNKAFRGGVQVAVGDLNGDGTKEIITGAGFGGGPHVRIFNKNGRLINPGFFAYNKAFRGGVFIASGDINGDGVDEIVTGVGRGGGPQVRVFNKDGKELSPSFFAFEKNNRLGVRVMVDNIDKQGKAEILASSPDMFSYSFLKNTK